MSTSNPVPDPVGTAEVPPARQAAVSAAREGWVNRLVDMSRRNNLLYFRDLRVGTLDLSGATGRAMLAFLQGEIVPLAEFVGKGREESLAANLREIRSRAVANLEERGLETLYLAMGMATWESSDGGRAAESAVVLIPAEISTRGREGRLFSLRRKGDIQINLVLLHVLESEFGVELSPEELIEVLQGDDEGEAFDPEPLYRRLELAASVVPGFAVKPRLVLGNFSYQKIAMVRDLKEFGAAMAQHDLIAALAGAVDAIASIQSRRASESPESLDLTPPSEEFLVLDADSSQQLVVRQALTGQDGVVHGPPGTGKSQTIANLIAEFAARGKKVLFVAEKRAALDVVLARLKSVGLGHLALDLHGADVSRRELMNQFGATLQLVGSTPPIEADGVHGNFQQRRKKLVEYTHALHAPRPPSGLSVFELHGRLLDLSKSVTSRSRWRTAALNSLTRPVASAVRDAFEELAGFEDLFLRCADTPWVDAQLADGATAQRASDEAQVLRRQWGDLDSALRAMAGETSFRPPETLAEIDDQVALAGAVVGLIEKYDTGLFEPGRLERLLDDLRPASRGSVKRLWAHVTNGRYRAALREARSLRTEGNAPAPVLLAEIGSGASLASRWKAWSSPDAVPSAVRSSAIAAAAWRAIQDSLASLSRVVRTPSPGEDLQIVVMWVDALAADGLTPQRLPRVRELEALLDRDGIGDLVEELRQSRPPGESFADIFEHAWLSSCLDAAKASTPILAGFNGRTHDKVVAEFRRLDADRIHLAGWRVRRLHAERAVAAMNERPEQAALVRREAARKMRHLPFRRLVREASDVLTALRPCWMASPLSVSHLLPADLTLFDVVLFDEASQVLPEDAVPALLRGRSAIVAGDRNQLPPTTFFVATDDDAQELEEQYAATQGFESILDLMTGLLGEWPLDWHYRSRDESLIAFSNRHIYDDRLVTFPAPSRVRAVSHVLVTPTMLQDGQELSSSDEVRRVVELVVEHARRWPGESLGVIALGLQHARRLEAALDETRRQHPELDAFFDETRSERFFIKNLERVQGDERDAIILSVGYGKDRAGKLPYRFGPLLHAGGERRLNVAITRARSHMTVVSSFSHLDMDPSRSKARGVELLRRYLEYAASGGTHLGLDGASEFPSNAFERDVCDALSARGMRLVEQWGASRYRIDLAALHPSEPGRFVLAIECDGASYHSSASARDRDRLRQQHLEKLGWRFHRIWSTDWFARREEEVDRTMRVFEAALRSLPSGVGGAPTADGAGLSDYDRVPFDFGKRGPKPRLRKGTSIEAYDLDDLVALVDWVQSDGKLRTDHDIFEEVFGELGFDRRGSRITAAIRDAIAVWRDGRGPQ